MPNLLSKTRHERKRSAANDSQKKQADKMLTATARQLAPLEVGSNVAIPIPDVDKGRAEFRNVLGVVKSISSEGLYEIGQLLEA